MTKQFLVPLLLPADPTLALEAATKQYVDATTGGAGDQYSFSWRTATTATDPLAGFAKANNADPTIATAVYISIYDKNGVAALFLLDLAVGGKFSLYQAGNVNTFIRYTVSGAITNNGPNSWFTIPVTLDQEGTTGFNPANNGAIQVGPARDSVSGMITQSQADTRYVNVAGDTMSAALTVGATTDNVLIDPNGIFCQDEDATTVELNAVGNNGGLIAVYRKAGFGNVTLNATTASPWVNVAGTAPEFRVNGHRVVTDPGATPTNTKFLRDDGSWQQPIVGVADASWPPASPQPGVLYLHLAP